MAKPTLLDLVQDILSDADGDQVDSISDTIESDQCARVIRDVFRNITDLYDFDYHEGIKQLTATSSSTPTIMERLENMHSVEWVMYDKRNSAGASQDYQYVHYMQPEEFVARTSKREASDSTVETMTLDSGHELLIRNDKAPTYYTFLQGYEDFVFDSYNSALETNLQQSKSLCYATTKPDLTLSDAAVIDLPRHLFTLLRNWSRVLFFDLYKGGATREMEQMKRRSQVRAQRHKRIAEQDHGNQTGPDFGRKRG